jgi:hypothetical protein
MTAALSLSNAAARPPASSCSGAANFLRPGLP